VLYVAYDTERHVVDVLEKAIQAISTLTVPPPLDATRHWSGTPDHSAPDALDQLRKLGELRDAGVLTDDEFNAKKAELLGRI